MSVNLPYSEVTPKRHYLRRREIMLGGAAFAAGCSPPPAANATPLRAAASRYSTTEARSTREAITTYNNYYEFGTDKADPAEHAGQLVTRPWTVEIGGLAGKPATFDIDAILRTIPLEERVYRLRCVEGWSMVIPWIGFPLSALLSRVEPSSNARFVSFETLQRPEQMPGQRRAVLRWPYREGLRLDEAMNPLTILAVGLYGETLLNQNGAPIRLVVPWKYGFKSIKAVTRIMLTSSQPQTAWNISAPSEYGFYSNVNPQVDHPRWSQATERRIGEFRRRPTQMFNGYGAQVASMYTGMNLRRDF